MPVRLADEWRARAAQPVAHLWSAPINRPITNKKLKTNLKFKLANYPQPTLQPIDGAGKQVTNSRPQGDRRGKH